MVAFTRALFAVALAVAFLPVAFLAVAFFTVVFLPVSFFVGTFLPSDVVLSCLVITSPNGPSGREARRPCRGPHP